MAKTVEGVMMSNTKQQIEEKYAPIIVGFLYGIQSYFLTKGEVRHPNELREHLKGEAK
mgnify:CR=1 FL=1